MVVVSFTFFHFALLNPLARCGRATKYHICTKYCSITNNKSNDGRQWKPAYECAHKPNLIISELNNYLIKSSERPKIILRARSGSNDIELMCTRERPALSLRGIPDFWKISTPTGSIKLRIRSSQYIARGNSHLARPPAAVYRGESTFSLSRQNMITRQTGHI